MFSDLYFIEVSDDETTTPAAAAEPLPAAEAEPLRARTSEKRTARESDDDEEDLSEVEEEEEPRRTAPIRVPKVAQKNYFLNKELENPLAIAEYEIDAEHAKDDKIEGKMAKKLMKEIVPRLKMLEVACRRSASSTPGKLYAMTDGEDRRKMIDAFIDSLDHYSFGDMVKLQKCARAIRVSFRKENYLYKEDVEDREEIYEAIWNWRHEIMRCADRDERNKYYIPTHPLTPKPQHLKKMPTATKRQRK